MREWIELLERDLGQEARIKVITEWGGQRRYIPQKASGSVAELELGAEIALWLAEHFGGTQILVPTLKGAKITNKAALLRAVILEAGLDEPSRSANEIALEFGVSSDWVRKIRSDMKREQDGDDLPLFAYTQSRTGSD